MRASPFDVTSPTPFVPALPHNGTPGCAEKVGGALSACGLAVGYQDCAKESTGTRSSDWLTGLTCLSGWLG